MLNMCSATGLHALSLKPNTEMRGIAVPSPDLWEPLWELQRSWHPMKRLPFPLNFNHDSMIQSGPWVKFQDDM